jgi:hypothetical protein
MSSQSSDKEKKRCEFCSEQALRDVVLHFS